MYCWFEVLTNCSTWLYYTLLKTTLLTIYWVFYIEYTFILLKYFFEFYFFIGNIICFSTYTKLLSLISQGKRSPMFLLPKTFINLLALHLYFKAYLLLSLLRSPNSHFKPFKINILYFSLFHHLDTFWFFSWFQNWQGLRV